MKDRKTVRILRASRPETVKKYHSGNALKNWLLQNYFHELLELAGKTGAKTIFEIGCGEGQVAAVLMDEGYMVRGCDIDAQDVKTARESIREALGVDVDDRFRAESVYDLDPGRDGAELVVCCEVLEHLEQPEKALGIIAGLANPYFIISVPREPLWCISNVCMLRNLKTFGNTPGHINHWSKGGLVKLASRFGQVQEVRAPFPFTMLLCRTRD